MSETNEPTRDLEADGELENYTHTPESFTPDQGDWPNAEHTPDAGESPESTDSPVSPLAVHTLDPDTDSPDQESNESAAPAGSSEQTAEPLTGFELVADMMRRQDEVLEQIDDLDGRINAMINQITAEREAEKLAELAALELAEQESSENDTDADRSLVRRAA